MCQDDMKTAEWGRIKLLVSDEIERVILHQEINPALYQKSAKGLIKLLEVANSFRVGPGDLIVGSCESLHEDR